MTGKSLVGEVLLNHIVGYKDGELYHYKIIPCNLDEKIKIEYLKECGEDMEKSEIPHSGELRDVALSDKKLEYKNLIPDSGLEWSVGHWRIGNKQIESPYQDEFHKVFDSMYHGKPQRQVSSFAVMNLMMHQRFAIFLEELDKTLASDFYLLKQHICGDAFHDSAVYIKMKDVPSKKLSYGIQGRFDKQIPLTYDNENRNFKPVKLTIDGNFHPLISYELIQDGTSFYPFQFELAGDIGFIYGSVFLRSLEQANEQLTKIHEEHPKEFILLGEHKHVNTSSTAGIPYLLLRDR